MSKVDALVHNAVYLSPSGRRCRLWKLTARDGYEAYSATFVYDRRAGTAGAQNNWSDGFTLAVDNFRLLREVRA